MFDWSGEMSLSSLGLLLILTACAMTMFAHPDADTMRDTAFASQYHVYPK